MSRDPLPRPAGIAELRRLQVSDLSVFQGYRHDPRITRYQDWYGTRTDSEASDFLARMNAMEMLQPGVCSQIGIAEREKPELLGDIGLTLAADGASAEIGYTLRPEAQGRGMGGAAVREAINLVFELTAAERVVAIVDPLNVRSIRLLERVGMRMVESRSGTFRDAPCIDHVYEISRFRVRPFEEKDRPALAVIYRDCRSEATWAPSAQVPDFERDTEGEILLVAVGSNDEPEGFISVWEPQAFIHHLYVRNESRNKGIGQELLDSLATRLPKPWRLKCVRSNDAALAFYLGHGWLEVSSGVGEDGPYAVLERA